MIHNKYYTIYSTFWLPVLSFFIQLLTILRCFMLWSVVTWWTVLAEICQYVRAYAMLLVSA